MSWLTRLLGARDTSLSPRPAPGEDYKGFRITPTPRKSPEGWRIAARIEKEVGGETLVHELLRADVIRDEETAREATLAKARQVIDEQGEAIFR